MPSSTLKRGRPSPASGKAGNDEPLDVWEDHVLGSIFRITLDPVQTWDHGGHRLHHLPGLRQELEGDGAPLQISITLLDQAILEAASNLGRQIPFDYLLGCFKRVSKQLKGLKRTPDGARLAVIKEARRVCMSYCIFAVTMPDMFGAEPALSSPLIRHLLQTSPEDDEGICHDFLAEITSRFAEDESAQEVILGAIEGLSDRAAVMTMNDDYKAATLVRVGRRRSPRSTC